MTEQSALQEWLEIADRLQTWFSNPWLGSLSVSILAGLLVLIFQSNPLGLAAGTLGAYATLGIAVATTIGVTLAFTTGTGSGFGIWPGAFLFGAGSATLAASGGTLWIQVVLVVAFSFSIGLVADRIRAPPATLGIVGLLLAILAATQVAPPNPDFGVPPSAWIVTTILGFGAFLLHQLGPRGGIPNAFLGASGGLAGIAISVIAPAPLLAALALFALVSLPLRHPSLKAAVGGALALALLVGGDHGWVLAALVIAVAWVASGPKAEERGNPGAESA